MNLINPDIYAASQGTLSLMPDPVAGIDEPRAIAAPWVAPDAPSWPACLGPTDKDEDEDDEDDEDEDEDDEEYEDDEEDDEGDEDEDDEDEDKDDKEGGEPPKPTRADAAWAVIR